MTPKELIQSMFDELAKGNSRRFVELMADDITWTVTGRTRWSGTYHGKDKVLGELLGVLRTRLDGPYRATAERILADGPYVVVQARGDAKTKAGVRYDNEYCFIYRVEDGAIKEVIEYLDTELVTSALTVS